VKIVLQLDETAGDLLTSPGEGAVERPGPSSPTSREVP
jgi:hypothetical protein